MKTIFIMGAFFDTNQSDLDAYPLVKQAFINKFKNIKLIEPIDIENYQKNYLKKNPNKTFLNSITAMVNYDLEIVKKADLLFVNLSNKSFGVGMELGIAKEYNKKVIFVAKENTQISNMVIGGFPQSEINYYNNNEELIEIVEKISL